MRPAFIMSAFLVCVAVVANAAGIAPSAGAQAGRLSTGEKRVLMQQYKQWEKLNPEEKAILRLRWETFNAMPAAKRKKLLKNYERWKSMNEDERDMLRKRYNDWQKLSPAQKRRVRKKYGIK